MSWVDTLRMIKEKKELKRLEDMKREIEIVKRERLKVEEFNKVKQALDFEKSELSKAKNISNLNTGFAKLISGIAGVEAPVINKDELEVDEEKVKSVKLSKNIK